MGVLDDMPGARIEGIPGPDGYSGCGLEKPEWAKPTLEPLPVKGDGTIDWRAVQDKCYEILRGEVEAKECEEKGYRRPRLRMQRMLSSAQCVQIRSSLPLTDDDKLTLAQKLKESVGQ